MCLSAEPTSSSDARATLGVRGATPPAAPGGPGVWRGCPKPANAAPTSSQSATGHHGDAAEAGKVTSSPQLDADGAERGKGESGHCTDQQDCSRTPMAPGQPVGEKDERGEGRNRHPSTEHRASRHGDDLSSSCTDHPSPGDSWLHPEACPFGAVGGVSGAVDGQAEPPDGLVGVRGDDGPWCRRLPHRAGPRRQRGSRAPASSRPWCDRRP